MCVFPKENVQVRHRTRARGKILQKVCSRRHFFDDFCFKVWIRIKIAGWICKKCSGAAARVTFFNVEGQGNLVSRMYVSFLLLGNHSRTAVRVFFFWKWRILWLPPWFASIAETVAGLQWEEVLLSS